MDKELWEISSDTCEHELIKREYATDRIEMCVFEGMVSLHENCDHEFQKSLQRMNGTNCFAYIFTLFTRVP